MALKEKLRLLLNYKKQAIFRIFAEWMN